MLLKRVHLLYWYEFKCEWKYGRECVDRYQCVKAMGTSANKTERLEGIFCDYVKADTGRNTQEQPRLFRSFLTSHHVTVVTFNVWI